MQAETVLDAAAELAELTRSEPGRLSGRIRLAAPIVLGTYRLAAIVADFCTPNPEVTVEMSLSDRYADLIAEGFDLAVRVGELQPSALISRRIGTFGFAVAASPGFLATNGTPKTPADLARTRCVLNSNIVPRGHWTFSGPGGASVVAEVGGGLHIDNGEAQRAAALAGAGVVRLPLDLIGRDIAEGRLVALLTQWETIAPPIYVVYPSRRLVPRRVTALTEAIASGFRPERAVTGLSP